MSRESRRQRRLDRDRRYEEQEAAIGAQIEAEKIQKATKREEEARALLKLVPEELALMAARELVAPEHYINVYQETARNTRSVALSNLAILSAMGALEVQTEQ